MNTDAIRDYDGEMIVIDSLNEEERAASQDVRVKMQREEIARRKRHQSKSPTRSEKSDRGRSVSRSSSEKRKHESASSTTPTKPEEKRQELDMSVASSMDESLRVADSIQMDEPDELSDDEEETACYADPKSYRTGFRHKQQLKYLHIRHLWKQTTTNNLCHRGESQEDEFKNIEPPPPLKKFSKHMLLDYNDGLHKTGFWVGFGPDIKADKDSTQADITRQINNYDRMKNEELKKNGQPNVKPLPWPPNPEYFIIDKPWSPTVEVEDAYPVRTRGTRRPPAPKKGQVLAQPQGQIVACQPKFNTGQHGQKTGQYRCTTPGCYKYGNLFTEYGGYAAHEERFHRNLFSTCTPCPYTVYRFGRIDTCNIEFETAKDAQKHCKLTHGLKPEQCYDFVCQVARNGAA